MEQLTDSKKLDQIIQQLNDLINKVIRIETRLVIFAEEMDIDVKEQNHDNHNL